MSQICIGGGSVPNVDAATILAAFGVPAPFWLTDDQYLSFIASPSGESSWAAQCTSPDAVGPYGYCGMALACVKSRSLLYCNKTPGDVAQTSALQQTAAISTTNQLNSEISQAASAAGTVANAVLPGSGQVIQSIAGVVAQIFDAHAQAVKAQADMLGEVCPAATTAIALVDAAVRIGADTQANATAALESILASFQQATASLTKTCNAFCFYAGCIQSIINSSPAVWNSTGFVLSSPATITGTPVINGVSEEGSPSTANAGLTSSSGVLGISLSTTSIALILSVIGIGVAIYYGQRSTA